MLRLASVVPGAVLSMACSAAPGAPSIGSPAPVARASTSSPSPLVPAPAASTSTAPTLAAALPEQPAPSETMALSIAPDVNSPNERLPEVAAARRLFPSAFGLSRAEPSPTKPGLFSYSTALFEGIAMPPAECLNSIAQPSIAAWQLHLLERVTAHPTYRDFTVGEALVLRDRASRTVLALPKGSRGALMLPAASEVPAPHDDDDARAIVVRLSEMVVIDRAGATKRFAGTLRVTPRGSVHLCADEPRYRAPQCHGANPDSPALDAPPYELDFRRCEPGCEAICSRTEIRKPACPSAPAPICVGAQQRVFVDSRDIGQACVFGEWDIECRSGCRDARCAEAPAVAWSQAMADGFLGVAADAQSFVTVAGDELVTVSAAGRVLRRERPPAPVVELASDGRGRFFTLDARGVLRAHGKGRAFRRASSVATSAIDAVLHLRDGALYVVHGNVLRAVAAADGRELWSVELGARARSFIATSTRLLSVVTTTNEAFVFDANGAVLGRNPIPEPPNGRFSLADDGTLTVLGTSGRLWSGRVDAMRVIARFPQGWAARGVVPLDADVALVTADDGHGRSVVHALELSTGRERWSHPANGVLTEAPSVGGDGSVLLISRTLDALDAQGVRRFRIHFRGPAEPETRLLRGADGRSLFLRDRQRLTKLEAP